MKGYKIEIRSDVQVNQKFDNYPEEVKPMMSELRSRVRQVAEELGITRLEETTKWGEPSFIAPKGSTLRMDWKEKNPEYCAIYFKCTSKLVPNFRTVFGNMFTYEKNRAIWLRINEPYPAAELDACIAATLTYHQVKNEPLLGLLNTKEASN